MRCSVFLAPPWVSNGHYFYIVTFDLYCHAIPCLTLYSTFNNCRKELLHCNMDCIWPLNLELVTSRAEGSAPPVSRGIQDHGSIRIGYWLACQHTCPISPARKRSHHWRSERKPTFKCMWWCNSLVFVDSSIILLRKELPGVTTRQACTL